MGAGQAPASPTSGTDEPPAPGASASPGESPAPKPETKDQDQGKKEEKGEKKGEEKKEEKKEEEKKEEEKKEPERWNGTSLTDKCGYDWYNCYGQGTVVSQFNAPFRSPYSGPNSFQSIDEGAVSETATLFIGLRMGSIGQLYFDPEVSGGRGLSSVFGLGCPPDGDIERVGEEQPTLYVARLYVLHDFALDDRLEKVESAANQLGGYRPVERLTLVVGKFSMTDWFDGNRYAHDPRSGFMNWALMDNLAWDYPADVRGYTWGGMVEWNEPDFAVRYALVAMPTVANGSELDPDFSGAHGQALEIENRYKFCGRPGKARWLAYLNQGHMGNYRDALALSPVDPDVTKVETYHTGGKWGFCLSLEQEFSDDLGGFLRVGWNNGQTETYCFTECDQSVSMGLVRKGTCWRRPQDEVGLGLGIGGLSDAHADYLAAGGLGFELGDGRLSYGIESVIELYYRWQISKNVALTPDLQLIQNPGYNTDRGPVFIAGARVHAEF
jgi:high affinity Mn2+ porin